MANRQKPGDVVRLVSSQHLSTCLNCFENQINQACQMPIQIPRAGVFEMRSLLRQLEGNDLDGLKIKIAKKITDMGKSVRAYIGIDPAFREYGVGICVLIESESGLKATFPR